MAGVGPLFCVCRGSLSGVGAGFGQRLRVLCLQDKSVIVNIDIFGRPDVHYLVSLILIGS